ncbi:MAG: phosphate ABC transporter permease PstA [Helicobacteraceae bacterium]|nr:phosphate ABC transporter permease PstA [Helicobacteraceae bacterium]
MAKTKKNIFYDPSLSKRHFKDKIFKYATVASLAISLIFLVIFLSDMIIKGSSAIKQSYIQVEVSYSQKAQKSYRKAVERKYVNLISRAELRQVPMQMKNNASLMGTKELKWLIADDQVDMYMKGYYYKLKSKDLKTLEAMVANGRIEQKFNTVFFTHGDSKSPEFAGILSAMIGTIFTILVAMAVAFPLGVATAIYLEEFSKESWWSEFLEVNINNLAAIPSILFGLLGLAIFINLFGLPRSSALVGGLTLALMTLPIIVVSSRAALRSVPSTIRQAGYGLGLTKVQVVKDHVLPLAFPGIMTGTILGLAQAMGETAPLIIVGMIAFIPDSPTTIMDAATVMPAQIFTWAGMPERAYIEKTAAGILTLLTILISLNAFAIYLRKRFEVKW